MLSYKVISIDYEFQRKVYVHLRKLQAMRAYSRSEPLDNQIKAYKIMLRGMRTHIAYSIVHKSTGIRKTIVVRDDYFKIKYLYAMKFQINSRINEARFARRIKSINQRRFASVPYVLCGGTHLETNSILKLSDPLRRLQLQEFKAPKTTDNYIGLEVECYGNLSRDSLETIIIAKKMHKWTRTINDNSIRATAERPMGIELNFMFQESEIDTKLQDVKDLLIAFDAEANSSCGLHVHLDARYRNVQVMFHNLVFFQGLLFNLNPDRVNNVYCQIVNNPTIELSDFRNHYAAISSFSYRKYQTIEVRIHGGTVNTERMKMWIKLLTKIANYPTKIVLENKVAGSLEDVPNLTDDELTFFRSAVA